MTYGKPFDRKKFLMDIGDYIKAGWGTYKELINLTIRDISEIKIGIESRQQEDQLSEIGLGG